LTWSSPRQNLAQGVTVSRSTAPALDLDLDAAGALAPLVTAQEAAARVASGAFLVDVRPDEARTRIGVIPAATVVDRTTVTSTFDLASADRLEAVVSHATPVVVVCGSVRGSGPVAAALREMGFTDVVHVEGGAPAWRDAGLPIDAAAGV
jgi:rhodanese-related sulfurtransferase